MPQFMMTMLVMAGTLQAPVAEQCDDFLEVVTGALQDNMIGKTRLNGEVVTDVMLKSCARPTYTNRPNG